MKLQTLLIIFTVFSFLICIIYREYSWSRSNYNLRNKIDDYKKDIESLKLELLIEQIIDLRKEDTLSKFNSEEKNVLGNVLLNGEINLNSNKNGDKNKIENNDANNEIRSKVENENDKNFDDKMDSFSLSAFQEKLSKIVSKTTHAININIIDLKIIMKTPILNLNSFYMMILIVIIFKSIIFIFIACVVLLTIFDNFS